MKQKLTLLLLALVTSMGAWAAVTSSVTIFDQGVSTFYDYFGTRANDKLSWTSGANSGVTGFGISLTGSNVTLDKASNWALVVHSSTSETSYTMTLTAPAGCKIKGYELKAQIWSGSYPNSFVLTAEDATSVTVNSTDQQTLTVSGLDATSTDIGIVAASASSTTQRWLTMKSLVVTLEFDHTITYVVKDESDNTLFSSSPVGVPLGTFNTLPAAYHRDYFFTYSDASVTINGESAANTNLEFTATAKSTAFKYTADDSSPIYYNLNIRSKYLAYNDEAPGDVELLTSSTPFNPNAAWAFIGDPYNGFKIINQEKGKTNFLTYTSVVTGGNGGNNNIQFIASGSFTNQYWMVDANTGGFCLRMKANQDIYFHHDNNNNFLRTCSVSEWGSVHNDAGSTLTFASDEDVLVALYEDLQYVVYGSGIGLYTWGGSGTAEEARANISGTGSALAMHATAYYKDLYDALLDIKANTTLNTPAAGFYRLKNVATGKYLTAVSGPYGYTSTTRGVYASNSDGNSAASIIRLYDKNGDGHLYMYNQGDGFGWVVADAAVGGGVGYLSTNPDKYVNWFPGNAAGQIAFAICYGNGAGSYASYLEKGIYTVDTSDEAVIGGTNPRADAAQWVVEAATSVTVTMHSDGAGTPTYYATFCAPFSYTVSDGTKAYTLEQSGDWLVPTEVVGTVAAGTPVLLKGTSSTATLTIGTEWAATPVDGDLTGTYLAKTIDGTNDYVLGIDGGVVGFYHWNSNNLAANRAYVDTPDAPVKGYVLKFDEDATGLERVQDVQEVQGAIYNLAGQRLNKIQKGINIVNGKKILK